MNFSTQEWHERFMQQAQWTSSLRQYLFLKCRIQDARYILDLGCGTGAVSSQIASPPSTALIGLDIDFTNLQFAFSHIQKSVPHYWVNGDAIHLPFSSSAFDIVYTHFVFLWLSHPQLALADMIRVTRPGGFILAIAEPDYGGRIDFPESLSVLGQLQSESLMDQGADPQTGRKLAGWFSAAGLVNIETGILGGQWQFPSPVDDWQKEWKLMSCDLQTKLKNLEIEHYYHLESKARLNGERVLFIPTFYAIGQVSY